MTATPVPTATRLHRVAKGTLANILGQLLNVGGQLALVPVLLHYWGNQLYGEWLALSAAVTYLTTFDLGMQSHIVNRLNQCFALRRMDEYARVLHTGLFMNLVIPAAGLLLIAPLIFLAPLDRWLQLEATSRETASWVALLLSMQVVSSIEYGVLSGIYRTINEYPRGQMIANARYFASLVMTVVLVLIGGQLIHIAAMQFVLILLASGIVYWEISRRRPEISIGISRSEWRLGTQFVMPSLMFLGLQVVATLNVQGSTLLVTSMFGAAAVVVFASLRTLSNVIRQAAGTIQLAVWPEFTSMEAQSESDGLRSLHLLSAKLVMLIAVCGSIFLAVAGEAVVGFWTRGQVRYDATLMTALLVYACSQSHWFASSILIAACGRQKIVLQYSAAGSLAGFALGFVLAKSYGMTGLVYGLAAADIAICGIAIPVIACRMIGQGLKRFYWEVTARSALLFAAIYGGIALLLPVLQSLANGFHQILSLAILIAAFGVAAAYIMSLNRLERMRLNAAIAGILAR